MIAAGTSRGPFRSRTTPANVLAPARGNLTEPPRAVLWVVDDLEANHHLVRRSLPEGYEAACDLVAYLSAEKALADLEGAFGPEAWVAPPDVVFMDFFLGGLYGNEVTKLLRAAFARNGLAGPFVIGHSSAYAASLEIVRSGGDVAIEKDRHAPFSRGVRQLFPDLDALRSHAGRAARPAP